MVKYIYREFKNTLNVLKYPDSWFWSRYTLNTYSGCAHSCIYCDARSERYYLEHDFENEVIIKTDFDKKLDQRLDRARKVLPDVTAPGGVNDAYQPIEKEVENTRKVLKVIAKHHFPINIATKSNLVIKDIDILEKIAEDTWCTVGFSITTTNEELANFLEPNCSSPSERLKAITIIKEKAPKIQVGTYFIPIIPFLEDDINNLESVIKQTKEAGADFVLFSPGLTMRDSQAAFFIKKLKNSKYNKIIEPLLNLYKGQMYPPSEYVNILHQDLYKLTEKFNLPIRIKRWIPEDFRKWNYNISELLLNEEFINLVKTGKSNKKMMWAGLTINNLEESILNVYKREELSKLRNLSKEIFDFIKPYLELYKELEKKTGLDKFL
jgi:DNA repair photolyase